MEKKGASGEKGVRVKGGVREEQSLGRKEG